MISYWLRYILSLVCLINYSNLLNAFDAQKYIFLIPDSGSNYSPSINVYYDPIITEKELEQRYSHTKRAEDFGYSYK